MMIITIPHPTLRQKAKLITSVDNQLHNFIKKLEKTLANTRNPKGIGLAANQVDKPLAICSVLLQPNSSSNSKIQTLINPVITDHNDHLILGETEDDKETFAEGCLSMPKIYGAVPRWSQIQVKFDTLINNELISQIKNFENITARVIQHEIDHLNGILFTDRSVENNLPVYLVKGERWEEIDPQVLLSY